MNQQDNKGSIVREAEGACFENKCGLETTGGSNPSCSAKNNVVKPANIWL